MPNDDVMKIMGVDEKIVSILPKLRYKNNQMCGWTDELNSCFKLLALQPGEIVLDIPCGFGGVSVDLAEEYGVKVLGYDILPGFVEESIYYSKRKGVEKLCQFYVEDIRNIIVRTGIICDLLLWIAPPHLWDSYQKTLESLRRCIRNGGYILIADAYTYSTCDKSVYPDYETFEEIKTSITNFGDEIIEIVDFKDTLWAKDYKYTRDTVTEAMNRTCEVNEKVVFQKYIDSLNIDEEKDTKHLGIFMMILRIHK